MTTETERLIIRPYKESDLPNYFRILSDRKNMYYLDDIITKTQNEARQSLVEAIELMNSGDARRFAIVIKGNSELIGAVGYDITAKTPIGRVGHMGWFILPEYQNQGYVTEAAKRVLTYAFEEDNCIRITTGCYAENAPTQKVIAKLSFRQEAERFNAQYHDGVMKDRLDYAITRDDWDMQKEITNYNNLPCIFDGFIEVPTLSDGIIYLLCTEKTNGIPKKKWMPAYNFAICKCGEKIGYIDLRIGYTDGLYYGGHIGYGINEQYRGNGYAAQACKLLIPVAKAHKMETLIITNNQDNYASQRVCEKLGLRLLRIARLPEWNEMYQNGDRFKNIYEWNITNLTF